MWPFLKGFVTSKLLWFYCLRRWKNIECIEQGRQGYNLALEFVIYVISRLFMETPALESQTLSPLWDSASRCPQWLWSLSSPDSCCPGTRFIPFKLDQMVISCKDINYSQDNSVLFLQIFLHLGSKFLASLCKGVGYRRGRLVRSGGHLNWYQWRLLLLLLLLLLCHHVELHELLCLTAIRTEINEDN